MTYRPGGGGESRRTISSVEADIRADEQEKLLEKLLEYFEDDIVYNGRYVRKKLEELLRQTGV